uniref:Bacterial HORMA domain-containing protein n=1 Tax=Marinomonas sp. (strain MWYL1) TaxID=400668 RepID=A6W315_MARMS
MTYSSTTTSTYTTTDVEAVMRRITADLVMIAASTGAITETFARNYANDIELLATNGYLDYVDLTLMSNGVELRATQFHVNESGELTNDRPGDARWPKVPGATLRIILSCLDTYDQAAEQKLSGKMKNSWSPTSDDMGHSGLTRKDGREYSSNGYGIQRRDYK